MTKATEASARIDAILADLPPDQREAMQALRETIAATAPDAVESIYYRMPAFRYHGKALVSYAAFKAHCSLFPLGSELIEKHREELGDFVAAKGTLRFTPDHRIPEDLVATIVRERMALIDRR